ncbi:MAG TPA: monovalent cation:proton antiporter-2 (CPA2) family protein [Ferruginibacter sp.]|nr:monovalent cation:proton antiporter-2 (CPA2) family protein [Ferruginibacter sp.]HMP22249.1 monovalent cation:proton antiporter-2 (CPA2) family protein [Ferruginibacter sp.]
MAGDFLQNALIYLGSAIVCVPLAKKMGIGSVLGYILAGILIGPFVFGFVGHEGEGVMHAAEFGVVMMLFIIGLELSPQSFWKMKNRILGLGGLQMLMSAALLFPVFYFLFPSTVNGSIALALSFAMSSTAIALQTLKERSIEKTDAGQSSFSVLLFQDIAVIPMLAVMPLLAGVSNEEKNISANPFVAFLQTHETITIIVAVVLVFMVSRFLINPFLHYIGRTNLRELFTAAALFIVIGVSWLMTQVGISAALGAFMAGVLLANSEFRHELESDIEPFKGLLLGVFFTAIGSTINFNVLAERPIQIVEAVCVIILLKSLVLFVLGRRYKMNLAQNLLFALLLSQAGEFVFVLLASIQQLRLLEKEWIDFYMAVVTITMILSPVLLFIYEKFFAARLAYSKAEEKKYTVSVDDEHEVIIAGFGHYGSTIGRFLRANNVNATFLDSDTNRVQFLRQMGFEVHYGDATRLELLQAAGAAKAKILISAIDSPAKTIELAEMARKHFPHLKLFLRARNRFDAYDLLEKEFDNVHRESLHSSVYMAVDVLAALGQRKYTLTRKANDFIKHDNLAMKRLAKEKDNLTSYITSIRREIAEQEILLNEDTKFLETANDNAWDNTSLKGDR